jgi:hypothetical protein
MAKRIASYKQAVNAVTTGHICFHENFRAFFYSKKMVLTLVKNGGMGNLFVYSQIASRSAHAIAAVVGCRWQP